MSRVRRERNSSRKFWLLLFLLVGLVCVIFFAAKGRYSAVYSSRFVTEVLSPFERAASWVSNEIHYVGANVWEIATVHKQNKMLRHEVEQLRKQNLQANEYAVENIRLRNLLGYKQAMPQFDLVAASVIGRESATWTRMIVINRGMSDGVREDMAVITEKGLVGTVTEASPHSAKVQLLLDPRAAVGTLVQRAESRVAGIVEGNPSDPIMPRMVNIPRNADVVEGDTIITSGFGGIYPKGLIVGTVSGIENDSGGLLKYALIETAVDFQKLEDVAVIVSSREAPPEPLIPPPQTPGTEMMPEDVEGGHE